MSLAWRPLLLLAAASAAGLGAPAAGRAEETGLVLLGMVAVEGPVLPEVPAPLEIALELTPASAPKVTSLREWFPGVRAEGGQVLLRLGDGEPAGRSAPSTSQRNPSFLVDFDEPAVAALRPAVTAAYGEHPGVAALAAFVDRHVDRKNLARPLDPASRVAARREGDCTEHAVLAAALARLFGQPSRLVLGVALLPLGARTVAAGHAWAEIHDGRRWITLDAVPLPPGTRRIPLAVADEGPGAGFAAVRALSPVDLRRVVIRSAGGVAPDVH